MQAWYVKSKMSSPAVSGRAAGADTSYIREAVEKLGPFELENKDSKLRGLPVRRAGQLGAPTMIFSLHAWRSRRRTRAALLPSAQAQEQTVRSAGALDRVARDHDRGREGLLPRGRHQGRDDRSRHLDRLARGGRAEPAADRRGRAVGRLFQRGREEPAGHRRGRSRELAARPQAPGAHRPEGPDQERRRSSRAARSPAIRAARSPTTRSARSWRPSGSASRTWT